MERLTKKGVLPFTTMEVKQVMVIAGDEYCWHSEQTESRGGGVMASTLQSSST